MRASALERSRAIRPAISAAVKRLAACLIAACVVGVCAASAGEGAEEAAEEVPVGLELRGLLKRAEADAGVRPAASAEALLEFRRLFSEAAAGSLTAEELGELPERYVETAGKTAEALRRLNGEAVAALDTARLLVLLRFEAVQRRRSAEGGLSDDVLRGLCGEGAPGVVRLSAARALGGSVDVDVLKEALAAGPEAGRDEWLDGLALWVEKGGKLDEGYMEGLKAAAGRLRVHEAAAFRKALGGMEGGFAPALFEAMPAGGDGITAEALEALGGIAAKQPAEAAGYWKRLEAKERMVFLESASAVGGGGEDLVKSLAAWEGAPELYVEFFRGLSGDFRGIQALLTALEEEEGSVLTAARLLYRLGNPAGVPLVIERFEKGGFVEQTCAAAMLNAGGMVPADRLDIVADRDSGKLWMWWHVYRAGYEVRHHE